MCQTKQWKNIQALVKENGDLQVIGERSDETLMHITEIVMFDPKIIANIINRFDSYRNCNCTNLMKCEKHKEIIK